MNRRAFIQLTCLVVPGAGLTMTGCAGVAVPVVAGAAPAIAGVLAVAAGHVGLVALEGTVEYFVERGWDSVFDDGSEADLRSKMFNHDRTQTRACSTKPVQLAEGSSNLVKFWTPGQATITFLPRAAQALSRAVEAAAATIGYEAAADIFLPIEGASPPDGTVPGDAYRTVTYRAEDGGTVQISFDSGQETVTALNHPRLQYSYAVDPDRPFYLQ